MHDLVIRNARIVDGTGAAWFWGDIAVDGDRIARITPRGGLRGLEAGQRIDVRGLVVAPGFIDIQSHSRDEVLTGDARVISKVTQGVTTEIFGEGESNAPANRNTRGDDPPGPHDFSGPQGFDRWLTTMERRGVSVNVGSFVGAGTVRIYAKGMAQGPATPAELDTMRAVLRNAMADGAFGLASALIYPPNSFAGTDELIEVARAMAPAGGVYITHMRSEGDAWLEAIDEAIQIGKEAGVPVEIYHLKAGGRRNWDKTAAAIARIDSARAAGIDVQANMYPYVAGATGLSACFPPWASADGQLLRNLADPAVRQRMRAEMDAATASWENLCRLGGPEGVMFVGFRKDGHQRLVGRRLSEVAAELGRDWQDVAMDLVLADSSRIETVFFLMSEENVRTKLRQPWIKFGTDAGGEDPERVRGMTHPRAYGTYPRILGRYVREERVLTLEDAVRKASSAVAARLSIPDRGLIRPGFFADLVVFDPATIIDHATFERPHQLSTGILHVFVNGVAVVRDGRHTGATPGRAVRGPGWTGRQERQRPQIP